MRPVSKPILLFAFVAATLMGCGAAAVDASADNWPKVGGIQVDRDGKQLALDLQGHVTAAGPASWSKRRRVVVSPDGRWRAVVQLGPWGDEKTGTVAIGRTPNAPTRIVERHLSGESPRVLWSPDSRWLALTMFTGRADSAVVVGIDGSRRVLARSFCGDDFSGFAWAPHGADRLALAEGASGTGCALLGHLVLSVRGVDGSGGVIAQAIKGVPSWSPDGRWIALSGSRTELLRADGSGRREVGGSGAAAWSPKGGLLAIVGRDPDAVRVGPPGGPVSTWETGVGEGPDPSFSPDGSLLAYQRGHDLLIRRVADRSLVAQAHIDDFAWIQDVTWSADGRSLLFDASGE
jgi:dipeptidyl aminopeptidase/acylaminoacyl peptidase